MLLWSLGSPLALCACTVAQGSRRGQAPSEGPPPPLADFQPARRLPTEQSAGRRHLLLAVSETAAAACSHFPLERLFWEVVQSESILHQPPASAGGGGAGSVPLDSLMPGDQCAPGGFFLNRTRSIFSALSSPCVTRDQAAMGQRCSFERLPGAHLHLVLSHLSAQKGRAGQGRAGQGREDLGAKPGVYILV